MNSITLPAPGGGNPLGVSFKSAVGFQPSLGTLAMPFTLAFTAQVVSITKDLFQEQAAELIDIIQSMYVDNTLNAQAFTISFGGIFVPSIPPGKQAVLPVIAPPGQLQFTAATNGAVNVQLLLLNRMLPYLVW